MADKALRLPAKLRLPAITPHPAVAPTDYSQEFAHFVWTHRTLASMTRRQLAIQAGMDPSYITLIERHGQIPRRAKVEAIGTVFGLRDEALYAAGMMPGASTGQVRDSLWSRIMSDLAPEAVKVAHQLACRPQGAQRHLVAQLAALLDQQDREKAAAERISRMKQVAHG